MKVTNRAYKLIEKNKSKTRFSGIVYVFFANDCSYLYFKSVLLFPHWGMPFNSFVQLLFAIIVLGNF